MGLQWLQFKKSIYPGVILGNVYDFSPSKMVGAIVDTMISCEW